MRQAAQRGKLAQPLAPWLSPESQLPPLPWKPGPQALDLDTLRFLLYRMSRVKTIGIDPEARALVGLTARAPESVPFADALLKRYLSSEVKPEFRWILTLSSIYGGPETVKLLANMVDEWTNNKRNQLGAWTVTALALNGGDDALRAIEHFSRKYRSKYRNVGDAALGALTLAAENLGISTYELADRLVPRFDFQGLYRPLDIGGATFRAFVARDLKINFLDANNRIVKSIPTAATTAQKAEFKLLATEMAFAIKAQSERLEQYLIVQRKWPVAAWQAFFLQHPVLFAHAIRLVWFADDAQQKRLFPFHCLENQTLADAAGKPVTLPPNGHIGIAHPMDLTPEAVEVWKKLMAQKAAKPLFEQLGRSVRILPDADRSIKLWKAYKGVKYPAGAFVSYLEKRGWVRGAMGDAGWINSFYKHFPELGVTAVLRQSGMVVINWYDAGEAELETLSFLRYGTIGRPGSQRSDPYDETDDRLIPFGDTPPIVYSEVVGDVDFFRKK